MTLKHLSTTIISIVLATCATCAQTISGTVTDSKSGAPVAGAHAIVLSEPDSTVIAYTIVDKDGKFAITKNISKACSLRITCLGYAKSVVKIKSLPANGIKIQLTPKAFNLKEVSVKKRAPGAIVKGDTVKFNLERYTDGTEQVLGDVLNKLPGVKVSEGGKVTAGGKLVDKLLLNGQDFAGEKHELLTKNLPSEMVEGVELLKNYNEYSILEGFKSKGTAINIGVDSAYMRRPTGNAELWGGHRDKYRAKGNIFFIGDEAMWSVNGKAYNTGEETMSNEEYMTLCGGVKNFAEAIAGRTTAVERPQYNSDTFISADMATRRRSDNMATANMAWNPSKRLKINAFGIFSSERAHSASSIERTFIGEDALPSRHTSEAGKNERKLTSVNLNVKCETSENGLATYGGTATFSPNKYSETTDFWGQTNWESDNKACHTEHDASYSHKISKDKLLTLRGYWVYDKDKTNVSLSSDTSQSSASLAELPTTQTRTKATTMSGGCASFIQRFGKTMRLRVSMAYDFDRSRYEADSKSQNFITPKSQNDCGAATASLTVSKTRGMVQFGVGGQLVNVSSSATRTKWKLLPEATLELHFSKLNTFELSYESELARDGSIPWASTKRLMNYRTIYDYSATDEMLHMRHSVSFFYLYYNRIDDISIMANGTFSEREKPTVYNNMTRGDIMMRTRTVSTRSDRYSYVSIDVDKGFSIPLRARVKINADNSIIPEYYDLKINTNRYATIETEVSLKTKFRSIFNIEVGGEYSASKNELDIMNETSKWRSYQLRIQPMAVSPEHGLKIKMPICYINDKAGNETISYVNVSFNASKKIGQHMSAYAEACDLLNTDNSNRITRSVEGDHEDIASEARMPGYLLLGVKWIF